MRLSRLSVFTGLMQLTENGSPPLSKIQVCFWRMRLAKASAFYLKARRGRFWMWIMGLTPLSLLPMLLREVRLLGQESALLESMRQSVSSKLIPPELAKARFQPNFRQI